jgi:hypothetical protein
MVRERKARRHRRLSLSCRTWRPSSEKLSTPSLPPRAAVTSMRFSRRSILTSCSEPTAQQCRWAHRGSPRCGGRGRDLLEARPGRTTGDREWRSGPGVGAGRTAACRIRLHDERREDCRNRPGRRFRAHWPVRSDCPHRRYNDQTAAALTLDSFALKNARRSALI